MSLKVGRRAAIAFLFGAPASYVATHIMNRTTAVHKTVAMRRQNQARNGRPVDPRQVTSHYNWKYWTSVGKTLPINIASGAVISFVVNRANNPLSASLRELEAEIPERDERPTKFRDTKRFAREVTRRSVLGKSLRYAALGSLAGPLLACNLDHVPTVEVIHGPMQNGRNRRMEINERDRTRRILFLQDCVAYMLGFGGITGAASHMYVLSTNANEVRNEVDKHRIGNGLSNGRTHFLSNERTVDDLRAILPDILRALGTELEVEINRGGEHTTHRLAFRFNGRICNFYTLNGEAASNLQDDEIPLHNGDIVTITVTKKAD